MKKRAASRAGSWWVLRRPCQGLQAEDGGQEGRGSAPLAEHQGAGLVTCVRARSLHGRRCGADRSVDSLAPGSSVLCDPTPLQLCPSRPYCSGAQLRPMESHGAVPTVFDFLTGVPARSEALLPAPGQQPLGCSAALVSIFTSADPWLCQPWGQQRQDSATGGGRHPTRSSWSALGTVPNPTTARCLG